MGTRRPGRANDHWAAAIDVATRVVFAFSVLAFVVAQGLAYAEDASVSPATLGGLVLLVACIAAMAVSVLRGLPGSLGPITLVCLTCVLYLGLGIVEPLDVGEPSSWWAIRTAPVVVVFVAMQLQGARSAVVAVIYVAVYGLSQLWHGARDDLSSLALSVGVLIAGYVAVRAVIQQLRIAAHAADDAAAGRRADAREEAEMSALARQTRSVDRMLHDDVIHALRAVGLTGTIPETELRALAADASQRLTESASALDERSSRPLAEHLHEVVAASGLDVAVTMDSVAVPPEVARALTRAVRESLRNTRLHSGVEAAALDVRADRRGVVVTVSDRGHGFDARRTPQGHVGVTSSLRQRMIDVGGHCQVHTGDEGTAIKLGWQPSSKVRSGRPRRTQLDGVQRAVAVGGSAFVALDVVQAAVKFPELARPWPAMVGTAVVALCWAYAVRLLAHGPVRARAALGMSGIGLGCVVLGGLSLPARSLDDTDFWLACGVAPMLLVGVLLRPLRESVWAAAAAVVLPIGVVLVQGGGFGRVVALGPAVLAPAYVLGAAYLLGAVVEHLAHRAAAEWERSLHSVRRAANHRERERVMIARLSGLRRQVQPLLAGLADGSLPVDEQVRADARFFEAQVRDQIGGRSRHVPASVSEAVVRLRRSGQHVDLAIDAPLSTRSEAIIADALRMACVDGVPTRFVVKARGIGQLQVLSVLVERYDAALHARWSTLRGERVTLMTDYAEFSALRMSAGAAAGRTQQADAPAGWCEQAPMGGPTGGEMREKGSRTPQYR